MPPPQDWYCGWCRFGPHSLLNDVFCCNCFRPRDGYCTFEGIRSTTWSIYQPGPNPQSEDPGVHSVSAVDTGSVRSKAASEGEALLPEKSSVDLSLADPVSSKDSNAVISAGSVSRGVAPNHLTLPTARASLEQKAAFPDNSGIRKDPSVNLNEDNVSQTGSIGKQSWLYDYLSVNPEDPWNHEWVVYGARTPLPGESSYSLETGEPATTSCRRPYDVIRRAEVAFTRNNGGACEPCRRRRRACPHRLQELAPTTEGDETASEQVMEWGGTRRPIDVVHPDVAAGIGLSTQYGGATDPEPSVLFAPIPRREPSQQPHGHRRTRAGSSGPLALAPSPRRETSLPSLALDDEPGIRRGRPRGRVGANSLGSRLARRSARHRQGINVMSGSSGSSRQSNNAVIRETSRDFAASTPVEETYSLGGTHRETEAVSYMYDGAGLRSFPPLPYVEQQAPLSEQTFTTQADTFDAAPNQRTSLSHGFLHWREGGYPNLGGTRARSPNVTDPPRSSSRNHLDLIPAGGVDESSSPFFRPSETPFWPSQQASFGQQYFSEQTVGIPLPMGRSSLPQTHLNEELMSVPEDQEALLNLSDEDLGWQIEDGPLLDAEPPEQIFDTALLDELLVPPEYGADRHATQLPIAMENNPRPTGPYHSSDIDPDTDSAWDDACYGLVDPSVDSPLESYAAYLGNPIFTVGNESTSGSNSDPFPTPPSDETG